MPDSSPRSTSEPFWRALQVAAAAVLGSAIFFLGLTRTQAGRDLIRHQIESAFNHRVEGTLSIQKLGGTLFDDVVMTEVQLRSPTGTLVASADSIVAEPRWYNLLTAELSLQSLTILRPEVALHRDSTGGWNLRRTLRSRVPSSEDSPGLDFAVGTLKIREGQLSSTRTGPAPTLVQKEWLFDYSRSQIQKLSLDASVTWAPPRGRIRIQKASFQAPELNLQVSRLQARLQHKRRDWSLDQVDLSLDSSRIRARASLNENESNAQPPSFTVQLERSRIDHDELRRMIPRLPLSNRVTVEAKFRGTPKRFTVAPLTITHDASFATLEGSLSRGSSPNVFQVSLRDSHIAPEDIREVWPALPALPDSSLGPLTLKGDVKGTASEVSISPPSFEVQSQLSAASPQGAVQGSLAVQTTASAPLTYTASLHTDSLNLAPLTGDLLPSSRLNGTMALEGTGTRRTHSQLQSTLDVALSSSRIGRRNFASVRGQVSLNDSTAQAEFTFRQEEGGTLYAQGQSSRLDEAPNYSGELIASGFDLSAPQSPLPTTRLNARLSLQARGQTWRSLAGKAILNVDSSRVFRGDSSTVLPPHSTTLRLARSQPDRPRVSVSGTVATATLTGTEVGPSLWRTTRDWGGALRTAVKRELDKPAPLLPSPLASFFGFTSPSVSASGPPRSSGPKQNDLSTAVEARAQIQIHRSDILHLWWPAFPENTDALQASAAARFTADSAQVSGQFMAERLRRGDDIAEDISIQYSLSGGAEASLANTLDATFSLSADRLQMGEASLLGTTATLSYKDREGNFHFQADSLGILGALQLKGDVHITPSRNELEVHQASFRLQEAQWTNPDSASVRVYSNAVVVSPLELVHPHPQMPAMQRLRVAGVLSRNPSDTLTVAPENLYLPPLSQAFKLPKPLGGTLNGQVDISGGWSNPKIRGLLSVDRISYDRRILGNVRLETNYSADSPDLRLNLSLSPVSVSADRLQGPAHVPGGARTTEHNRLTLSGRIRLPAWAHQRPRQSSQVPQGESMDLTAQVARADLFFFRYIFEKRVSNVKGYVTGPLHIGGSFREPVFDASFSVESGSVTLSRFGLKYEVSGSVTVDRQGIHLQTLNVRDDKGTATISGGILFNRYEYFSFDLSGSLNELTVMDVSRSENLPFYGHIRASGPATLTGPLPDATLRSNSARTTPNSELFIPVYGETVEEEAGFIVFADSTGQLPKLKDVNRRRPNILADRPEGVPTFVDGLNVDLNIIAPEGSTVNLVFDQVVGDVVTAVGSGRVQLQRQEGDLQVFGSFNASSGHYLFTAGELFVRRFSISEGTITWDGNPINAKLDLDAEYRTRASPSGLPGYENYQGRIPVTVNLDITGRVATPRVDLSLSRARDERGNLVGTETLDAILNQPARRTEYATSVLLTNTFLLTTESFTQRGRRTTSEPGNRLTAAGNQLAFNSVSQLVSSQLNRYLGAAFPNVDLNLGVQGENPNDLDLIYGGSLRLLNDRLLIRGEGVYTGDDPEAQQTQGPQVEFTVEVHLSPSVSANLFYRRRGDELTQNRALTSSRGLGLSYQTQFSSWLDLFGRLFGWLFPFDDSTDEKTDRVATSAPTPPDSTRTSERPPPERRP